MNLFALAIFIPIIFFGLTAIGLVLAYPLIGLPIMAVMVFFFGWLQAVIIGLVPAKKQPDGAGVIRQQPPTSPDDEPSSG